MIRSHLSPRRVAIGALTLAVAGVAGTAAGLSFHAAATSATPSSLAAATSAAPSPSAAARPRAHRALTALARLLLRATVKETGLSRATVLQDLRAGRTFAQIAGTKQQAVQNDVVAEIQSRLTTAVSNHRISQTQADTRLAKARTAIGTLMTANLSSRLGRGHAPAASASPSTSAA